MTKLGEPGDRGMTSVVLIGYGAIARMVVDGLARTNAGARVVGVLVRPAKVNQTRAALPRSIEVIPSPDKISAIAPDLVVECAGSLRSGNMAKQFSRRASISW